LGVGNEFAPAKAENPPAIAVELDKMQESGFSQGYNGFTTNVGVMRPLVKAELVLKVPDGASAPTGSVFFNGTAANFGELSNGKARPVIIAFDGGGATPAGGSSNAMKVTGVFFGGEKKVKIKVQMDFTGINPNDLVGTWTAKPIKFSVGNDPDSPIRATFNLTLVINP
jgi:hypothetical protein